MNTSTKTVSMSRKAPRNNTMKDYSDFTIEGRKGKVQSRTKRINRNAKRSWNEEV